MPCHWQFSYNGVWLNMSKLHNYERVFMKILRFISIIVLCTSITAYSSNDPDSNNSCQQSFSFVLAMLEKGVVQVKLYTMPLGIIKSLRDGYEGELLFSLDLGDNGQIYTLMSCDQSTEGNIIIRSENETMYDYCLNWGPMLGVDLSSQDRISYVNVAVEKLEQGCCYLVIEGQIGDSPINIRIFVDKDVTSACACTISDENALHINHNEQCMSLTDACRLGVVATISRHQPLDVNCDLISELEFDRIIDSMMQDGTIKIKEDTPWMFRLKSFGSALLVKYLAVKNYIARIWSRIMRNEPLTVQKTLENQ